MRGTPTSELVVIAAVLLAYATVSRRLRGTALTAPMVFVGAGFLLGVEGLGWLHLSIDQEVVKTLAEATLAVVLFADASRVDLRALRHEYLLPVRLLGIGLPLTIAAGTVVAALVLPDLSWAEALVLAIVLAPTDAALGQAVVTDQSLPSRIRQGLNIESGLNDGLCVPLLTIALAIAETEAHQATGTQAIRVAGEAIGWGIAGGAIAGVVAALAERAARRRNWIEGHWLQVVPVAGAVGAFGLAQSRGGSGFIAAFVGGAVFGVLADREADDSAFTEELGGLLNGVTLIVFGAAVLGELWSEIGFAEVGYAVLSLTIVRMVPVAIAMIGSRARLPTVVFVGWFGPRGLASIVFGVVIIEAAGLPHQPIILAAITATVALSTFVHGATAAPLARRYARWHARQGADMESTPVPDQRWRNAAGGPSARKPNRERR